MCLGAIYWARPEKVYYVNTREQAARIGFDDEFIYNEIQIPISKRAITFEHLVLPEAHLTFDMWANKKDKMKY